MLHDLYMLETYYGYPEAAQSYGDMVRRYGLVAVNQAWHAGEIMLHGALCPSRTLQCWLTPQGRGRVQKI